jgi:hypothetical protein
MTINQRLDLAREVLQRLGLPVNHVTIAHAEEKLLDLEGLFIPPGAPVSSPPSARADHDGMVLHLRDEDVDHDLIRLGSDFS